MNEEVIAILRDARAVMHDAAAALAAANARITDLERAGRELLIIADRLNDEVQDGAPCQGEALAAQLRALDGVIMNHERKTAGAAPEFRAETELLDREVAELEEQVREARARLESREDLLSAAE